MAAMWPLFLFVCIHVADANFLESIAKGISEIWDDSVEKHTYHSRIFDFDASSPKFPEATLAGPVTASSVGLALSGGGSRAMTAATGQLLGLKEAGLLDNVQYISATSGGSWAASVYGWANVTLDTLLGSYIAPGNLTAADLDNIPDQFLGKPATMVSKTGLAFESLSNIFKGAAPEQYWNLFVQENIFKPWSLSSADETKPPFYSFWAPYVNKNIFRTNTDNLITKDYNPYQTDRAFVIVNMGMVPKDDDPYFTVGVECSAVAVGIPAFHPNIASSPGSTAKHDLGGGWTEPFSFNSAQYHSGKVTVLVKKAEDLESEHVAGGDPDGFVRLRWAGEESETQVVSDTKNPEWNEEVVLTAAKISPNSMIELNVRDSDTGLDDNLGAVNVSIRDLDVGVKKAFTLDLEANGAGGQGKLFVEVTLNEFTVNKLQGETNTLTSESHAPQWSLRDCVGTASSDLSLELNAGGNSVAGLLVSKYTMLPLKNMDEPRNLPVTYNFIDGGEVDNSAVMPLLIRKIPKIIICANNRIPIEKVGPNNEIRIDATVSALFGYQPKVPTDVNGQETFDAWKKYTGNKDDLIKPEYEIYANNQVFPSDKFFPLLTALLADVDAKRPLMHKETYTVVANSHWGIESYSVEVIWYYNMLNQQWKDELSSEALAPLNDGTVQNFPQFDTTDQLQLKNQEVNLMVNMWAYTMAVSTKTDLVAFFGGSAATTDPTIDADPYSDYAEYLTPPEVEVLDSASPTSSPPKDDSGTTRCASSLVWLALVVSAIACFSL
eukprot:TRINITY_DN53692_c0_g1_i1.p1 TRINITY_DN53692_c0_g1~~TRINITY_DN53692_c0_g1_i1.p1  ORF type:complete len:777 (-),score=94.38 TRINITY_DN53692_c0_g1_i1:178-2508(-)